MKNRLVAILLAFFLGLIGVHHFYLGNTGRGVLYLILFFTGIGTILNMFLVFFDFLGLCFMSDASFNKKYNKIAIA
jgi:TM2 domain-containing membrane protein YozV